MAFGRKTVSHASNHNAPIDVSDENSKKQKVDDVEMNCCQEVLNSNSGDNKQPENNNAETPKIVNGESDSGDNSKSNDDENNQEDSTNQENNNNSLKRKQSKISSESENSETNKCTYVWSDRQPSPRIINVEKWGHKRPGARMSVTTNFTYKFDDERYYIDLENGPDYTKIPTRNLSNNETSKIAVELEQMQSTNTTEDQLFKALREPQPSDRNIATITRCAMKNVCDEKHLLVCVENCNFPGAYLILQTTSVTPVTANLNKEELILGLKLDDETVIKILKIVIQTNQTDMFRLFLIYLMKTRDDSRVLSSFENGRTIFHEIANSVQIDGQQYNQIFYDLFSFPWAKSYKLFDKRDNDFWTPLMYAIEKDKVNLFASLVEKGDPHSCFTQDQEGNTALHWMAYHGTKKCLEMFTHLVTLVNWDSIVQLAKIKNNYEEIPLHYAVRLYKKKTGSAKDVLLEFIKKLVELDPSTIHSENKFGMSSLFSAKETNLSEKMAHFHTSLNKEMTRKPELKTVVADISKGRERFPISAVTDIFDDDESMMGGLKFRYVRESWRYAADSPIRRDFVQSLTPCDCITCDRAECRCRNYWLGSAGYMVHKPEGQRATTQVMDVDSVDFEDGGGKIFECGELCQCDLRQCQNRVCQRGCQFMVEIFYSKGKGWVSKQFIIYRKALSWVCMSGRL